MTGSTLSAIAVRIFVNRTTVLRPTFEILYEIRDFVALGY